MKKLFITAFMLLFTITISAQEKAAVEPQTKTEAASETQKKEESEKIADSYLTGDWGGSRQSMVDNGVTFEVVYLSEILYNAAGGIEQDYAWLGNLDVTLDIDMGALAGISGMQVFLYGLGGHGDAPTELLGDAQATSNIETGMDYFKLYEAYIQQSLFDDKVAILAGMHDLNSEFYANDPAGVFTNSSMGIGTEIAQAGPSIFPAVSPALRLLIKPTESYYFSAAGYNAITTDPDDPEDAGKTYADFSFDSGFLTIAETGLYVEGDYKFALGGWMFTDKVIVGFDEATTEPIEETGYGAYLLADKTFGDISVFVRFGMTNADIYPFAYNIMEGIVLSGAMWGRGDDSLGIGATTIITSAPFKKSIEDLGGEIDSHETSIELTYILQLTPWMAIQPDVQYVLNPGADPSIDDALAMSLRVELVF
ncbi:MAG: carbohydrate porin [Spirochaetia bacterium]|nr:carbohydrate porin [Spirochaetia bacterium]